MICNNCQKPIVRDEITVWDYDDEWGGQGEKRYFCGQCEKEFYPTDDDWRKIFDDWVESK
ncbi:hypothetical protein LCGC14_3128990 [marine sediment metagenome]|uniref:Uncharacterized protein n=1 Tax=marine sediment metagenome TaxID=412755 RepID=A0A0F8YPP3_9ZZZZ